MFKGKRSQGVIYRGFLRAASVLALSFLTIGCGSFQSDRNAGISVSPEVAPGVILIDVLEGGQPEPCWQYEVQPATGMVRLVKQEIFQDYRHREIPETFYPPTGAIETCGKNPEASSPDENYMAGCRTNGSYQFYVADRKSTRTLQQWKPDKNIRGFGWAPNSNSVAILSTSGRLGMRPLELLSLLSGHLVSHDTVFLELLDVRTGKITEFVIRRNVISSSTRILNWSARLANEK
jgi:hypothetical protein